MDYEEYRKSYFVDPPPEPRFELTGVRGIALFYEDYAPAVAFYQAVLGPAAYVEGEGTRSWKIGDTWLTLLQGLNGLNFVAFDINTVSPPHDVGGMTAFLAGTVMIQCLTLACHEVASAL